MMRAALSSREVSLAGALAALYAVLSLVPISTFIGASSLLSLNLAMVPVIAILLRPPLALLSALAGATAAFFASPGALANIFGPFTLLMPTLGAFVGSVGYRARSPGAFIAVTAYFAGTILLFLMKVPRAFFWVAPHVAALLAYLASRARWADERRWLLVCCFLSTMAEQACMMNLAAWYLGLRGPVFAAAFPLMLYERALATVGGYLLVSALRRAGFVVSPHPSGS